MNNQQSYQTANYRGGQQGFTNYLSNNAGQPSFASSTISQYQGNQKPYQPTGFVQSVYGQNQQQNGANAISQQNNAGWGTNPFQAQQSSQFGILQNQNPQSFHAANYRGNQPGHDNVLRADSTQASQSQFNAGIANSANQQYAGKANIPSILNTAASNQFQAQQNPQSFHAANYQGNQPGHDQQWRADSTQPTNLGSIGAAAGVTNYGSTFNQGIGSFAGTAQAQAQSPQSFHAANYQGNQPGHDQQWRADSTQPTNYQASNGYGQR